MSILVIDLGTSSVRAAVLRPDGTLDGELRRPTPPDVPMDGLVEFDARAYADKAIECAREVLAEHGPVRAVGISTQRATTIVWDRGTGEPVAPAQGWQDLRTLGDCLVLNAEGFNLAPNLSATKIANILDAVDPGRERDLCFGTPDSWIVWNLSRGESHISDATNAGLWGLMKRDGKGLDQGLIDRLRIPVGMLPRVVDSTGDLAVASVLDGSPPICGIAGDQQASLIGQACVEPGMTKITFGTGAMLDVCLGDRRPVFETRGQGGTFPLIAWSQGGRPTWGAEAIMLSAGTSIDWLRDDMGLIETAAESGVLAAQVDDTGGVVFVPALLGLGTPQWDYGARGTMVGITRGTTSAHVVRSVLEGVAHRGVDLIEAAEADCDLTLDTIRVDGGMAANSVFVQALADAAQRRVEIAPATEATAVGAGYLAGLSRGTWGDWSEIKATWRPSRIVEPGSPLDRERWRAAVERAKEWYPELSALDF